VLLGKYFSFKTKKHFNFSTPCRQEYATIFCMPAGMGLDTYFVKSTNSEGTFG
jgi:hypothetical protein